MKMEEKHLLNATPQIRIGVSTKMKKIIFDQLVKDYKRELKRRFNNEENDYLDSRIAALRHLR